MAATVGTATSMTLSAMLVSFHKSMETSTEANTLAGIAKTAL